MAEIPNKKQNKADYAGIRPMETKEAEVIHTIPKSGNPNLFFEKSQTEGARSDRLTTQQYTAKAARGYEINASGPPAGRAGLPALELEQYAQNIEQDSGVPDESKGSVCYGLIGAGQCGGRLVRSFYDIGYKKVVALNTSKQDLDSLDIPPDQKYLMGPGDEVSGRDMDKSANAVRRHRQDILHLARQTFGTKVDHIMVCFGAGGGAGGGSVVELIDMAKRYARYTGLRNPGKNVGVIMTLPAVGKVGSPLVVENAYKVAHKLSRMAQAGEISPLIILDNDKISRMYPKLPAKTLWLSINRTFAGLFHAFNRVSALGSRYTCFDRLDYLSIMESGGCMFMGRSKVDKPGNPFSISEAVKNSLENTLFADGGNLSTAKVCGCIVVGGKELMAEVKGLQENIDYAFDILSETTAGATIHRGIYEDNSNCLWVYTIVGGLDSPADRLEEMRADKYFNLDILDSEGPPLRERKEDILFLAEYFLAREANLYDRGDKVLGSYTKKLLLNYPWPGNVRELAKAMKRAHELSIGREIQPDALPFKIIFADVKYYPKQLLPALAKVQRRIITKAFRLFKGNKTGIARILGVDVPSLEKLIEELNLPGLEVYNQEVLD
jgi:cell division GTPase FtsZ